MYFAYAEARARLGYLSGVVTRLTQLRAARGSRLAIDGGTQLQSVDDIHLYWISGRNFGVGDSVCRTSSAVIDPSCAKSFPRFLLIAVQWMFSVGRKLYRSVVG